MISTSTPIIHAALYKKELLHITVFRVVLALLGASLLQAHLAAHTAIHDIAQTMHLWSFFALWLFAHIALLHAALRNVMRNWTKWLATSADLLLLFFAQNLLTTSHPDHISIHPIAGAYSLVIIISAFHRNHWLPLFTAVLSSLLFWISAYVTAYKLPTPPPPNEALLFYLPTFVALGAIISTITHGFTRTAHHLQHLFENTPSALCIVDKRHHIVAANTHFSNLCRAPFSDIYGQNAARYLGAQKHRLSHLFRIEKAIWLYATTGENIPIRISSFPLHTASRNYMALAIQDISEEAELTQQIVNARKMETVIELTRGFAHDFNNIFSGITGAVSLAQRILQRTDTSPAAEKTTKYITLIQDCSHNATRILNRLCAFRKEASLDIAEVSLCDVVDEVADICRNLFPPHISLTVQMPQDKDCTVPADVTALSQATLNLCLNAQEALGARPGNVWLRILHPSTLATEDDALPAHSDSHFYCIEVTDDGPGIAPEIQQHIFDPFFSTKDEGTGIGLAMVAMVAQAHHGSIHVAPTPQGGARFRLCIPASYTVRLFAEGADAR
ncbi:MAG: ATP-binding protein [Proteobacteria bacterium]|nr:ATP-binding protein [Pseudomonadota bacterium]